MSLLGPNHRLHARQNAPYQQICREGLLKKYAMGQAVEDELVEFIFNNRSKLREVSLRMVLKIADLWRMAPDRYQDLAQQTCMRAGV